MMKKLPQILPFSTRRTFLSGSTLAAAFVLGFRVPGARAQGASATDARRLNAWLAISADGTATIMCPSAEMGQGVFSTLPAIVAEELGMPWDKVAVEIAPGAPEFANPVIGLHATFESTSVRGHFEPLRRAGAAARAMLVNAAAARWEVPARECTAVEGQVRHEVSGRQLDYGDLAADAARLPLPADPEMRPREEWRLLGTALPRKDTPEKVEGSAVFGIDIRVPGMLVGTVQSCPIVGGTLQSLDESPALAVPGVRHVVTLPDAVIVVAVHYWAAAKGLRALSPEWEAPSAAPLSDDMIGEVLEQAIAVPATFTDEADEGVDDVLADDNGQLVESDYHVPYLAHATMEPMNATAHYSPDGIEVWAPTQAPQLTQFGLAGAFSQDPARIVVHSTFLGGGFGRRSEPDFAIYAVAASRAAGVPVKVIWSREQDVRKDYYRPRSSARLTARLDKDGRVAAWRGRFACQSIMTRLQPESIVGGLDDTSLEGAFHLPYDLGQRRTEYALIEAGLPVGFWRSPGHNQNAFFTEGFVDELAEVAGKDPLAFRLSLLEDKQRHANVLRRAADMIDWRERLEGHHKGIALHEAHGSIVAEGVEIEWLGNKRFRIARIACAVDCGTALNPDTIVAQMESGIVFALSAALYGEINVEDSRIRQSNFTDYRVLRINEMPPIETAIIESDNPIGGIGEPSTPPLAPALASALFSASGTRIRQLPLSKQGFQLAQTVT